MPIRSPWHTNGKPPAKARVRRPVVVTKRRAAFGLDQDTRREAERIELFIPAPPSSNSLFDNRMGGRAKTEAYDGWLKEAGYRLAEQKPARIAGAYELEIYIPRSLIRRGSDLGNREKAVSDLLVKMRVISDDSLAQRITLAWWPVGEEARVDLTRVSAI